MRRHSFACWLAPLSAQQAGRASMLLCTAYNCYHAGLHSCAAGRLLQWLGMRLWLDTCSPRQRHMHAIFWRHAGKEQEKIQRRDWLGQPCFFLDMRHRVRH